MDKKILSNKVLLLIERILTKYPDLRLGQIMASAGEKHYETTYYINDKDLYDNLREVYPDVD